MHFPPFLPKLHQPQNFEWGARIDEDSAGESSVTFQTIDIAAWMVQTIPDDAIIVMKSDIEGLDTEVLNIL